MRNGYLFATTNFLVGFDGTDRFYEVHSGQGLYYGLAAHGDAIYVGCRNQIEGTHDPSIRAGEAGSILVFNSTTLDLVDELRPLAFNLRDLHGIGCAEGRLWVTCSFDDAVAICDLKTREWTRWYPMPSEPARGCDTYHFNTVQSTGNRIRLLAHQNGPSHLLDYDASSWDLVRSASLGHQAHDIILHGESPATCSSGEGLLVDVDGWALRTGGFPRGISISDDRILVGISQIAVREERHRTSAIVREFDTGWRFVSDFLLRNVGMILSILPFPIDDRSIERLAPFPGVEHTVDQFNRVLPGNVYALGERPVIASLAPEWHMPEVTHRWTAAREARFEVVINPDENMLAVEVLNGFPGSYHVSVFIDDREIGSVQWREAGQDCRAFPIPPGTLGRKHVSFRVPHLWQPSLWLGTADERKLGIGIMKVSLHRSKPMG
jgi:hypothetical protein